MEKNMQPTLFDEIEKRDKEIRNEKELDNWALLYTATAKGNNSGVHFMMTMEDARKWCSSELSRGVYMGAEWAYFFTSVKNFAYCHWGGNHSTNRRVGCIDLRHYVDNSKWDEKIKALGLKKYDMHDMKRILEPLVIEVLT